ncbi:MAG: thiamine phosphate synthase [Pseudomonadota bacterium]
MPAEDRPQIYLVTPPEFELSQFPNDLARVLDDVDVACVRLDLATREEDRILRAADACRAVTEPRDVALVLGEHVALSERAGLDGVHLTGARGVRAARAALGSDAIVGAACGASRHDGMNAGEAGADYVAFGPVSGALGDGQLAEPDLFAWWSEVIEVPIVAEGGLDEEVVRTLWETTDFMAFREEVWRADDPAGRLSALMSA